MVKIFKPNFTISNRITAGLTLIERARGFLEAAMLSEAWVREMGHRALILEAHHTRMTSNGCSPSANIMTGTAPPFIGLSRTFESSASI